MHRGSSPNERGPIARRLLAPALATTVTVTAGMVACSSSGNPLSANTPPGFTLTSDPVKAAEQAGVRMLPREGAVVHEHSHLDVEVNGQRVTVPANIGVARTAISELHTHDTSGILHIEADAPGTFTLKQLFTEWGVELTDTCLATHCTDASNELRVYVDGKQVADPTAVVLREGQEIYVWYGPKATQPSVPASYTPAPAPRGA